MTAWACVRCCQPLDGDGLWCPTCQDDTTAIEIAEPEPLTPEQRIRICVLFRDLGEVHRATRMRRLTQLTGRYIADYGDVTTSEAHDTVIPALEEETRGIR